MERVFLKETASICTEQIEAVGIVGIVEFNQIF